MFDLEPLAMPKPKSPPRPAGVRERRASVEKLLIRLAKLRMEGLRLYAGANSTARAFHASRAKWRVLDGSNQSAKTTTAAAEIAYALCGCDPYDKYPVAGGRAIGIGLNWKHVGDPMWRKLGEPGAFKIIRDEETHLWRSIRPSIDNPRQLDPYDAAYSEKWRDAPPLLPSRLIQKVSWEDPAKRQPALVIMTNGWRMEFCSSDGKPKQGAAYNVAWPDEQMLNGEHYKEACRGMMALANCGYTPRGIWSATPQNCNPELLELRERAESGSEFVEAFQLLIDDNPFIADEEKKAFWEALTPEEREVRYYGKYAIVGQRLYPTYNPMGIHGCEAFELPADWTRFLFLDPGSQYCGTLLFAVDPEERHTWLYGGFLLRNADAHRWAEHVVEAEHGVKFECLVIDRRMGKQHPVSMGLTVAQQYSEALAARNIEPRSAGYGGDFGSFYPSDDNVRAREEALLGWLRLRQDGPFVGTPTVQVMRGMYPPRLDQQVRNAHYRLDRPDKRAANLPEDLLDPLEYAASFRPYYRPPEKAARAEANPVWDSFQKKQRYHKSLVLRT